MSSLTKKTRFTDGTNQLSLDSRDWNNDAVLGLYDEPLCEGIYAIQSDLGGHPLPQDNMTLRIRDPLHNKGPASDPTCNMDPSKNPVSDDIHDSNMSLASDYLHNSMGPDIRKGNRSSCPRHRFEVTTELGPEEVRWFYKEDKKTWKPFMGHDSLRIEMMYRRFSESQGAEEMLRDGGELEPAGSRSLLETSVSTDNLTVEAVCVRGGLYEVDVRNKECSPVYWNRKFWLFGDFTFHILSGKTIRHTLLITGWYTVMSDVI